MIAADVFTTLDVELKPDPSRTVIRPFSFVYPDAFTQEPTRIEDVAARVLALAPETRDRMLSLLTQAMEARHHNVKDLFLRRFEEMEGELADIHVEAERDRLLLGAYYSQEYAFESAALFNPSIVTVPDQDPNAESVRFIVSLRGVGEGHISSVTFRSGIWDGGTGLVVDPPSAQGVPPRIESDNDGWVRMRADDSQDISETVIFPISPVSERA